MSNPNPKSEYNEAMEQFEKDIGNKISESALKGFKIKLLQAKMEAFIIPDLVLEMIDEEIKLYVTKI